MQVKLRKKCKNLKIPTYIDILTVRDDKKRELLAHYTLCPGIKLAEKGLFLIFTHKKHNLHLFCKIQNINSACPITY